MANVLNIKLSLELFHEITGETLFGPVVREYSVVPKHAIDDISEIELQFLADKIFCTRLILQFKARPDLKELLSDKPWNVKSEILNVSYSTE